MVLLPALSGVVFAAGVLALVAGIRGWAPGEGRSEAIDRRLRGVRAALAAAGRAGRLASTAAGAVAALLLTGWPVAAMVGGVAAWVGHGALGRRHDDAADRAEAIALWAEILRDAMGTAWEIETVLSATAPSSPRLIRAQVTAAAGRLAHESLDVVLDDLAARLGGGSADLVIAALRLAGRSGGRQVRQVLDDVARAAYGEAEMLNRIKVARQTPVTSARFVTGITAVSVVGTVVFAQDFLEPYDTASGQLALLFIALWCTASLGWMARMTRVDLPARFTARREERS